MIVKTGDAERFIEKPPRGLSAALVFGPDQGLVRERVERLVLSVVPDLNDAFRVSDLDDSVLLDDAARLYDEAAAIAMLGGRRVVRVRGAGNALAKLFESFLDDHAGDALVVVESGELARGTGLRRVFEEHEKAYAVACYPDSQSDLFEVVRAALKAEGLSIEPEALEDAVSRLGSDRGVTRRELEKLVLYVRGEKRVTLADVRAAMGDEAEARIEEACDAAAAGDLPKLDLALERLWLADTSPVAVVRTAMGHFQRLALLKSYGERGESADAAIRRLRPPVHFARVASLKAQLQKWSEGRIGDALELLLDTEALCKTTAVPPEAVCARALFNVAAMARARLS
jgi:DNA polymerase III subunit delta